MKPLFITGIDTGVGKTVIAAIITEKLKADYWKPVQSGDLDDSDTLKITSLVTNNRTAFHKEAYRLTQAFSPHKSAGLDNIHIEEDLIVLPQTTNRLVIEGAGGLFVPLNKDLFIIDLIKKFDAEAVLVVKNYLGSINHTLLSIHALRTRGIPLRKIIINGLRDEDSESVIQKFAGGLTIEFIETAVSLNKEFIINQGKHLNF